MGGTDGLVLFMWVAILQSAITVWTFIELVLALARRSKRRIHLIRAGASFGVYVCITGAIYVCFFGGRHIWRACRVSAPSSLPTLRVDDHLLFDYADRTAPHRRDLFIFRPPATWTKQPDSEWFKRVIGLPGDRVTIHDNRLYVNGVPQIEPYVGLYTPGTDRGTRMPVSTGKYEYDFPVGEKLDAIPTGANAYVRVRTLDPWPDPSEYEVEVTHDRLPGQDKKYLFFVHNDAEDGLEAVVPAGQVFLLGDNRNDSEDSHLLGCVAFSNLIGRVRYISWPLSHIRSFGRERKQ